ncbi:DUF2937 family protein [Microvirga roseola]|uniref:DUF2937 family protein n=1 Tax=Microvirga roseola TaxID=2883126 RepID=UPI001E339A6F|nr:DUF2937 family protein [Microvirga roseola]
MFRIARIFAFGLGLLGGIAASQLPEFAQQYRQRLGGAVDELRIVVRRFEADASASGETRESAIARLRSNPDVLVSNQGAAMQTHVERLGRLETQRKAMIQAGPFKRIAVLMREGDGGVMRAAYRDFEPAVPVTQEGIISAAAGFFAVWGGVLLLAGLVRTLRRSRRQPPAAARA